MSTCGKQCEVYTRIVGYFRPVQRWNDGKKEEYKFRQEYLEEKGLQNEFKKVQAAPEVSVPLKGIPAEI
ncbi:hypothetical protein COY95_03180 [Candidatus Woesearchaeota archaeon CG_4_10_14_0_8_um_filter_47_5]|nr:MAG: hypothetical protein COY95_03180 [Candidatus Woesearchaeota archaeon CG_4_10_14_0_8_um_filter_47_5]